MPSQKAASSTCILLLLYFLCVAASLIYVAFAGHIPGLGGESHHLSIEESHERPILLDAPETSVQENDGAATFASDVEAILATLDNERQLNGIKECVDGKHGKVTTMVELERCFCTLNPLKEQRPVVWNGAFCPIPEEELAYWLDKTLAAELLILFEGSSVGDFGAGSGHYSRFFADSGRVKSVQAYDGSPSAASATNGFVKFLDLTKKAGSEVPVFEWVMSVEVGEHIPRPFELVYIDNLVRHARVGVVISWCVGNLSSGVAKPYTGRKLLGRGHVNNRSNQEVIELFDSFGLEHDAEWSQRLRKAASFDYLRDRLMVFRWPNGNPNAAYGVGQK